MYNLKTYSLKTAFIDNEETSYSIDSQYINSYKVSKDSQLRNYNLHHISINGLDANSYTRLSNGLLKISIEVFEEDKSIRKNVFKVLHVEIVEEENQYMNLDILMIGQETFDMLNSFDIGSNILLASDGLSSANAFTILGNIIDEYAFIFKKDISFHYNDHCMNNFIYDNIRLPNTLNNLSIFTHLINEYNPYYLKPYIIFDDFHYSDIENNHLNLFVNNLCLLKDTLTKDINDTKILEHATMKQFLQIFDKDSFKETLKSTIVLKNPTKDSVHEIRPKKLDQNTKIEYHTINEDVGFFIKKLKIKNLIADGDSSYKQYSLGQCNLDDIQFNRLYNISSRKYNDFPIAIEYIFNNNSGTQFSLQCESTFACVPDNLMV